MGKIERWHQTLQNCILLENHYLLGAFEQDVGAFIDHYKHVRCNEEIGNVKPADASFDRTPEILEERRRIKTETPKTASLARSAACRKIETIRARILRYKKLPVAQII